MDDEEDNGIPLGTKYEKLVLDVISFWKSKSYSHDKSPDFLCFLQIVRKGELFETVLKIALKTNEVEAIRDMFGYYDIGNKRETRRQELSKHINDLGPLLCKYFSLTNEKMVKEVIFSYLEIFDISSLEYFKGNRNCTNRLYQRLNDTAILDYNQDLQYYFDKIDQDYFKIIADFKIDFTGFNELTTETRKK